MAAILSPLGLSVFVYAAGASGVPDTSRIVDQLSGRIDTYSHTIAWQFGFESMSCSFVAPVAEAVDWLANGLMRSVVVYGPDAETVWEGYIQTVEAQFGQERRSLSLEGMANRVRVRYTTVLGTPGTTATASETTSQGLYGIKDGVFSLGESDATEAANYRDAQLTSMAYPMSGPSSEITTSDLGEVRVTLTCEGWYGALAWLLTSNTSTTKTTTTTQVQTLLTAYNSTNNFFSTDYSVIYSSGVTATEFIAPDTSYRDKIEALLKRGDGSYPYAWGVYEGRRFFANYFGSSNTVYQRYLGAAELYDDKHNVIRPWNARPDFIYQVIELLDITTVFAAYDQAAEWYVARVSLTINESGTQLTLEPKEADDLAAILVTKYG